MQREVAPKTVNNYSDGRYRAVRV